MVGLSKVVPIEVTDGQMRPKVEVPPALVGLAGLVVFVASISSTPPASLP